MNEPDNKPLFHGFNPNAPVRVYRRNLPHWRQCRATYFVTFRLGDSIPRQVFLGWQEEDRVWLNAHEVQGAQRHATGRTHGPEDRATGTQFDRAIDALPERLRREFNRRTAHRLHVELDNCHGSCLLRQPSVREVVTGALHHFHGRRWWVGDLVVMPNHVHGLFQPITGNGAERRSTACPHVARSSGPCSAENASPDAAMNGAERRSADSELETILGSVKGFVSTRLSRQGVKSGKLWQQENYDRLVRDREELGVWRRYIRRNPEKAGLAEGEYTYYRCDWLDKT